MENEELPKDSSFITGQHVLVCTATERMWVKIISELKQKLYVGYVCSRMHKSFGKVLQFKQSNILETIITEG